MPSLIPMLLAVTVLAVGCPVQTVPLSLSPATGTVFSTAQTVTLVAVPDPTELARYGVPIERIDFQRAAPGGEFAISCSDTEPPYTCDWPVTFVDNGIHRWTATVVSMDGAILSGAGTQLQVQITPSVLPLTPPGDCTDGVDCVCDQPRFRQGDILNCEDYEHPAFIDPSHPKAAWSELNGNGRRGQGSLWSDLYGIGDSSALWRTGEPVDPSLGITCESSGQGCATAQWISGDPYGCPTTNELNYSTPPGEHYCKVGFVRTGEYDDDEPTITAPSVGPPGGGAVALWQRVPEGSGEGTFETPDRAAGGIPGGVSFGGLIDEFGYTFAMALASNVEASGILDFPWKFNEPSDGYHLNGNVFLGTLPNVSGDPELLPFRPGSFFGDCEAATRPPFQIHVGQSDNCRSNLKFAAERGLGSNQYTRSVHWPYGTWACVRVHYKYDSSNGLADFKVSMMPSGATDPTQNFVERTMFHATGIHANALNHQQYSGMAYNAYTNINQNPGHKTRMTTGRFVDNEVYTRGVPVQCADIGFTQ